MKKKKRRKWINKIEWKWLCFWEITADFTERFLIFLTAMLFFL